MIDVAIIVVNYNYGHYILNNYEKFTNVSQSVKKIIIIDDQSDDDKSIRELSKGPIEIIQTSHKKSKHNNMNQINSVYCALNHIARLDPKWIWVIDGDDCPLSCSAKNLNDNLDDNYDFIAFGQKIVRGGNHKFQYPRDVHRLWVSGATTSTIICKYDIYRQYEKFVRSSLHPRIWLDIRLSAIAKLEAFMTTKALVIERLIHDQNDSLSYENKRIIRLLKIFHAVLFASRLRANLLSVLR